MHLYKLALLWKSMALFISIGMLLSLWIIKPQYKHRFFFFFVLPFEQRDNFIIIECNLCGVIELSSKAHIFFINHNWRFFYLPFSLSVSPIWLFGWITIIFIYYRIHIRVFCIGIQTIANYAIVCLFFNFCILFSSNGATIQIIPNHRFCVLFLAFRFHSTNGWFSMVSDALLWTNDRD